MFLGLDIGTSGVKAVVIDVDGLIVAQSTAPLSISRLHPLWSEQDPADWWAAVTRAVANLPADVRGCIRGIGLSGQMHGATLLDAAARPLRPAILWNDGRSARQCADMEAECPDLPIITGNRAMPGFTAPKLRWVAEHEPRVFERVKKVLLPKDYVRLCMTGDYASDMSDAAGTLWLDVAQRDWSQPLLAACGLTAAHMPTLHEGPEITGVLRSEVATAWGMAAVPVVAGASDNAAGAIGCGVVEDGEASLSLGTSGVLFVANAAFRPNSAGGVHAFCHALPGRWHQMAVILSASSCIDWAVRLLGLPDAAALFALVEGAGGSGDDAGGGELFLPYLSGERTPHNDPDACGVLFGLNHDSGPARIAAAVLEGVAFAFRDGLDALSDAGTRIDQAMVIGGGARSRLWGRILASALGIRLVYREGGDVGPAYGAARLARIGIDGVSVEAAAPAPAVAHVVEPDAVLVERFAPRIARYRALYRQLSPLLGNA